MDGIHADSPAVISGRGSSHGFSQSRKNPFAAFEILPMPLIVLSSDKIVLSASRAVRKLLAWPPAGEVGSKVGSDPKDIIGKHFQDLGIHVLDYQGFKGIDLSLEEILDGLSYELQRTLEVPEIGITPISNVGAGIDVTQRFPEDDDGDFDPWPEDDWSRGPDVTLLVKVQRQIPGSKAFKARLIARVWKVDGDTVFLLTIGRPLAQIQKVANAADMTQSSKQARKLVKQATLAKMQRALFNSIQWPCFFFSADETMYYPNEAGEKLTGKFREDYMYEQGKAILEKLHLYDENFERKVSIDEFPAVKIVRTRERMDSQRYGFMDFYGGNRVRLDVGGECVYDEHTGEFLGSIVWCNNVTEYTDVIARQQFEIDRGFENKLDNMPNLMFTAAPWPLGEADYFSKQWFDYTGHPHDYNFQETWREALHADDMEVMWPAWMSTIKEGNVFEMEARYRRRDGQYRWHLVRAVPQRDHDGMIVKWHGTFIDIHDLVAKRTEARRRKQQMITVLAHAEVNMFALNQNMETTMLEGKIRWGPAAGSDTQNSEIALGQFIGNSLAGTSIAGTAGADEMLSNIRKILDGTLALSSFEQNIDGRWYKTRIIPDIDYSDDGTATIVGVLGLSMDITDVKARIGLELERTQLLANEQAAQEASRLKSQFLANVSHELRTPIAGVLGMADLLVETVLDVEQKEYARSIQQSADSLLTIVNDILDFSKIESGRFDIEDVQFDLPNVLADLVKLMAYAAQRKGLILDYQSSLISNEQVIGDPGRVRQILMNLLTNAIKFTSQGNIKMHVHSQETEDSIFCTFVVEDSGIGIRPSVLKKLFRPFSQGDSSTQRLFGGTGLGLTICKELSNLMKGSIGLVSTPGVGTKATFSVPFGKPLRRMMSIDESTGTPPVSSPQVNFPSPVSKTELSSRPLRRPSPALEENNPPPSLDIPLNIRNSIHVLVVEDNAINQNIAMKLVKKIGFRSNAVWNGEECIDYLANPCDEKPRPAIILMDCQMPIMDGYEATKKIRTDPLFSSKFRDVPIIALTASAIVGDREKCKSAGMDDYVTKPVSKQELERALLRWAQRTNNDMNLGKQAGSTTQLDHVALAGSHIDQKTIDDLTRKISLPPSEEPPQR